MKLRWCTYIILLLETAVVVAQGDSVQVTRNFRFQDGIYLSFEDLQANRPALRWEEVDAQLVTSQQEYLAQAEYIRRKEGGQLPADAIWGLCLEGTPFVRLPDTATEKRAMVFAALRVRGRICYYTYEVEETRMVEIAAYNPLTGRPFRRGAVPRKVTTMREKMLHFEDGRQRFFRKEEFLDWIADDPQLWSTVAGLSEGEVQEKLYKCLLIYDDRNPVYVPAR
ncbi:MAG: hypothetical protein KDD19_08575 [Phaeodactylibacter sp.]|nr:hypothetical protein [Phaeodactylibacter sp.]MCB9053230.1 hypothetical protein [Lewinellaceae bacterium]